MCESWQALHVGCCGAVLDCAAEWSGSDKTALKLNRLGWWTVERDSRVDVWCCLSWTCSQVARNP